MASRARTSDLLCRGTDQLCRRCWRRQAGLAAEPQRRWIGQKYLAKVAQAKSQWDAKAQRVAAGTEPNLWDELEERGFVKDTAPARQDIRELMRTKRVGAYVGVDPTAPSLHIGHLVPLMPLYWMYMHGYRAVTLIGGATATVGDPTGRLKTREKMEGAKAVENMAMIHYQLKKLWANVEVEARRRGFERDWAWRRHLVNNSAWWNKKPFLEVLQRLGQGMRIGPMLSRDTVKDKMTKGDGMSFAEFAYPLMQGWDWWQMFSTLNVQMQIGGSDQYGNILAGINAIKVIRDSEPDPANAMPQGSPMDEPAGFTVPLLTDSSGTKFGKSEGNALWLDPIRTSPYDLYGYFMRRPDAEVEKLLKLFTFLPMPDIQATMAEHNADPPKRVAQHLLAYEVLHLVHGTAVANRTRDQHRAMYDHRLGIRAAEQVVKDSSEPVSVDDESRNLAMEGLPITLNNAPEISMELPESLIMGKSIARIIHAAGFTESISAANRLVFAQGAYIGGSPGQPAGTNKGMTPHQLQWTPIKAWVPEHTKRFLIDEKLLLLRKGQHNVRLIRVVSDEEYERSGQTYPGQPNTGAVRRANEELRALKKRLAGQALSEELTEEAHDERALANEAEPPPAAWKEDPDTPAEGIPQTIDFPTDKSRQEQALKRKIGSLRGESSN